MPLVPHMVQAFIHSTNSFFFKALTIVQALELPSETGRGKVVAIIQIKTLRLREVKASLL